MLLRTFSTAFAMHDSLGAIANKQPLLTAQEEIHLSLIIKRYQETSEPSKGLERAAKRARERFILANTKLVLKVAAKFMPRCYGTALTIEDLFSEGIMGLNRAIDKFDPARGYKFSTYSFWWIRQAIQRAYDLQAKPIRLPGNTLDIQRRWRYKPVDQSLESFCEEWGYTVPKVREQLAAIARAQVISSDRRCKEGEESSTLLELIPDENSRLDIEHLDYELALQEIEAAMPDEAALIALSEQHGQTQMADLLDTSQAGFRKHLYEVRQTFRSEFPSARRLVAA